MVFHHVVFWINFGKQFDSCFSVVWAPNWIILVYLWPKSCHFGLKTSSRFGFLQLVRFEFQNSISNMVQTIRCFSFKIGHWAQKNCILAFCGGKTSELDRFFCMQMHSQVTFQTDIEISLSVLVFSSEKDFFVSSKKHFKFFTSVSRGYL